MKLACIFEKSNEFTVGEVMSLICMGRLNRFSHLKIEFENPEHQYALKILDASLRSNDTLHLKVTGYKPGEYKNVNFQIRDGTQVYQVENLSWSIVSVLKGSNKEVKPFPPYGPWLPYVSPAYFGALGLLLVLTVCFIGFQFRKANLKKKLRNRICDRLQGKTPLEYFIWQITPYVIQSENLTDIEKSITQLNFTLDEFLENKFEISKDFPLKKKISQLKYQNIIEKQQLIDILSELHILNKEPLRYTKKDIEQMIEMIRSWVFLQERM